VPASEAVEAGRGRARLRSAAVATELPLLARMPSAAAAHGGTLLRARAAAPADTTLLPLLLLTAAPDAAATLLADAPELPVSTGPAAPAPTAAACCVCEVAPACSPPAAAAAAGGTCPDACSAAACVCSCRRAALTALWNLAACDLLPLPCKTISPRAEPMMSRLCDSTCRRCCTTCW
jgi:hypothetical protein